MALGKMECGRRRCSPDRAKVGLCKAVRTSRTFSARAWHRGCGRRRPRSRGSLGPPGFARPLDQLEKSASLTGGSPVLVQKCKVPFLKFAEPFVPGNRSQRALPRKTGEVDSQNAGLSPRSSPNHSSRMAPTFFCPSNNSPAIGGRLGA